VSEASPRVEEERGTGVPPVWNRAAERQVSHGRGGHATKTTTIRTLSVRALSSRRPSRARRPIWKRRWLIHGIMCLVTRSKNSRIQWLPERRLFLNSWIP